MNGVACLSSINEVGAERVSSETASRSTHFATLKQLRDELKHLRRARNGFALWLFCGDVLIFGSGQGLVLMSHSLTLTIVGSIFTWIGIVRLFVIGHDACHGSFTSRPWLNKTIGRLAFLPSLTAFSLWRVGHNVMHHGFNNLKGKDFVWTPHDEMSYLTMSPRRRCLERLYRSAWGPGIYYVVEIWWKRLCFPGRQYFTRQRWEFHADFLLTVLFLILWMLWLELGTRSSNKNLLVTEWFGFGAPFVLWNWTMGLTVYLHHTHSELPWFDDKHAWKEAKAFISATSHVQVPSVVNAVLHQIMEHPVHHLDPAIPLYRLNQAQKCLTARFASLPQWRFTLRKYLQCVKYCKLYDYRRRCWVSFPTDAGQWRSDV